MKKVFVVMLVLLLGLGITMIPPASTASVGADDGVVSLDEADNGGTVDLWGDQELVIDLEGNPSTGYMWEVASVDDAVLQRVGQFEFEHYSDAVGSAGRQTLRFRAAGEGQTDLVLAYRRSWEDVAPVRTYTVDVRTAGPTSPIDDVYTGAAPPSPARDVGPIGSDAAPADYNWCSSGGCTPVKDQGYCGSCWAFATSGVVESLVKISDGVERDLAEQYLVSCNIYGWGCSGGGRAFDYFINTYAPGEAATGAGAVYETDYPYLSGTDGITRTCTGSPHTKHEKLIDWDYVAGGVEYPSVAQIQQAIQNYGPVYVSMCAGPSFQAYTGGVFSTDESSVCGGGTNHGVVLVGWDDSQSVWYLRNSWGPGWGETLTGGGGGYMRIGYGTSNVGRSPAYAVYQSFSNVGITKGVVGSDFAPGDPITFTLAIENSGSAVAAGVVVTDVVPAEVLTPTFASTLAVTPTGVVSYVWQVEPLSAGESGVITVYGWIDPSLPGDFSFTNQATISDPEDTTPGNNTSSVIVGEKNVYLPLVVRGLSTGIVNGDFEQGSTGWERYSTHGWPLIMNSGFPGSVAPHSGSWAVWLGGDYDDLSYIRQQVTVPPGRPYLAYYHWIASQDVCGFDYGGVIVDSTSVDEYDLCEDENTGGWVKHVVNLSAYTGQSVALHIFAVTDGFLNSNLFIDDVSFQASATSGPEDSFTYIDPEAAVPRSE